jgi:hypothetical protein
MKQLILFHITIIIPDVYLKILEYSTSFPFFNNSRRYPEQKDKNDLLRQTRHIIEIHCYSPRPCR